MAAKPRVLVDVNVILDVLQRRESHYGAQYLITRNVEEYQAGPLPVLQPAEFLALLASS